MEVVKVLGLQLCLLAFSLGSEIPYRSSFSDSESHVEPHSAELPPYFETDYGTLQKAEQDPEFGLEMKYQAPQDYDIMLKAVRAKRQLDTSGKQEPKNPKPKPGAFSVVGSKVVRAKRQLDKSGKKKKKNFKPKPGTFSLVGSNAVRAKRQLDKSGKQEPKNPKPKPGAFSVVGSKVVRAKRQLDKSGKQQKKKPKTMPGAFSPVGKAPTQGFVQ